MSDDIYVDPAAIQRHAGQLSGLMGHIREAARDPFRFDPQTYGLIGAAWTWSVNDWVEEAVKFVNTAADCGDRVSEELINMADDYQSQEEGMKGEYKKIFDDLKGAAE